MCVCIILLCLHSNVFFVKHAPSLHALLLIFIHDYCMFFSADDHYLHVQRLRARTRTRSQNPARRSPHSVPERDHQSKDRWSYDMGGVSILISAHPYTFWRGLHNHCATGPPCHCLYPGTGQDSIQEVIAPALCHYFPP